MGRPAPPIRLTGRVAGQAPIYADGAADEPFIPPGQGPADGVLVDQADDNGQAELEEDWGLLLPSESPTSPLNQLRNRRSYWQATM